MRGSTARRPACLPVRRYWSWGHDSQPWAPWTYLFPVETRFAALDPAQITQGADGTRRAPIMLVERRGQTVIVPQDFDCAGARIRPGRRRLDARGR